jgi:hypothetical protein
MYTAYQQCQLKWLLTHMMAMHTASLTYCVNKLFDCNHSMKLFDQTAWYVIQT